jgi:nucleotide-binding universal stress UspA family protein
MPLPIRRILVAVADGAARRVTRRAGDLALKSGAPMELFSVIRPDCRLLGMPSPTLLQIIRAITEGGLRELDKLAQELRRRGLEVACTVVTSDSLTESVTRRLHEARADIVALEAHKHPIVTMVSAAQ